MRNAFVALFAVVALVAAGCSTSPVTGPTDGATSTDIPAGQMQGLPLSTMSCPKPWSRIVHTGDPNWQPITGDVVQYELCLREWASTNQPNIHVTGAHRDLLAAIVQALSEPDQTPTPGVSCTPADTHIAHWLGVVQTTDGFWLVREPVSPCLPVLIYLDRQIFALGRH
jgi:hypothetical protein